MFSIFSIDKPFLLRYYDVIVEFIVTLTKKGLVYIPKAIQDKLKLFKPSKVKVSVSSGRILIEPLRDIRYSRGTLKQYAGLHLSDTFRDRMEKEYVRV